MWTWRDHLDFVWQTAKVMAVFTALLFAVATAAIIVTATVKSLLG
jgi:hypothetical protein